MFSDNSTMLVPTPKPFEVSMLPLCHHHTLELPDDCGCGDAAAELRLVRYERIKVAVDIVLSAVLLVLTGPVIVLLMGLVKLTSRGSALYSQVRLGKGGRPYTIYKIRTMAHDCERFSGPRWALSNDPRVTLLGGFLRRCHLDELPQLINVLRGEMSLIGPRPERPIFVEQLQCAIPDYRQRLSVRPGVTGLAQVLLPADTDLPGVQRKVACDLCYIDRMGFWLDARILLATALKVAGVPFHSIARLLRLPVADAAIELETERAPDDRRAGRDGGDHAAEAAPTAGELMPAYP